MPRIWSPCLLFFGLLLLSFVVGCQPAQPGSSPQVDVGNAVAQTAKPGPLSDDDAKPGVSKPGPPEGDVSPLTPDPLPLPPLGPVTQTTDERYDAALAAAYEHLGAKDEEKALAALQEALVIRESDFVKAEIARVQALVARNAAADKTAIDIQTILTSGRADEAARLAASALEQFGDSDSAEQLARLKRQADALLSTQLEEQPRRQRFLEEAEAARQANNLRAALLAYDQAVSSGANVAPMKDHYETIRVKLTQYDQGRARGAELRRDPYQLEEAVVAFQAAAQAWDTPVVRQELRECELAIASRRDRVAVADFETNADIGLPRAGHVIAEELLPHFKARFDLVERSQLGNLLRELQLEASDLHVNDRSRAELGRLAKARYMVLGSVSSLYGITVNARLVDVQSGLIVQTGKVVGATPEEVVARLPVLARILMMSDEEKIQYERELAQRPVVQIVPFPFENAVIPALPEPPAPNVVLPAPILFQAPPPAFGRVVIDDFGQIPVGAPAQPVVLVDGPRPVRERAVFVSIEVGDNLFRRGQFQEAFRHFEFALALAPQRRDIALRIDRCRPFLPPPPVVVQPIIVRPRLAVLPFVEIGRPGFVPPGLGVWTAQHIAPHFAPAVELVDQSELFWWMGRLGLTYRDVLINPHARLVLARALNARHFLMGALEDTASFDARTYLVDTEFNVLIGSGRIHVHSPFELKCRLGELARMTASPPAERAVIVQQVEQYQTLVVQARTHFGRNEFAVAIQISQKALAIRPDGVEVRLIHQQALARQRQWEVQEAQRLAFEREQARNRAAQQRQLALAAAAEQARIQAERRAALFAAPQQQLLRQQQLQAHTILVVQARAALQARNFPVAINAYEGALALNRTDELVRELAQARATAAEQERRLAAEQQAAREAELRRQQEAQLAETRNQLAQEQRRRAEADQQRQLREATRLQGEYQKLLDAAQQAQAKGNLDAQVSALQAARRLRPNPDVERLLSAALVEQARFNADRQGAAAKAQLERELAAERERRLAAEAEAKRNQQKYQQAVRFAREAMARRNYGEAVNQFRLASLTVRTDEAITGLKQAEEELAKSQAAAKADAEAKTRTQRQEAEFQKLLADGRAAREARQLDKSLQALQAATRMRPNNVDAQAELTRTQQALNEQRTQVRRQQEAQQNLAAFRKLLDSAKANIAAKQYDAALVAINEALKLQPNDPQAQAALKEVQTAQAMAARGAQAQAEAKKRRDQYEQHMQRGRTAMGLKNWDGAAEAFRAAQQVLPGDMASAQFLKDVEKAKTDAESSRLTQVRDRQVNVFLDRVRAGITQKRFDEAEIALNQALKLDPKGTNVLKAQADLAAARQAHVAMQKKSADEQARLQNLLTEARKQLTAKQLDAAEKTIAEAAKLAPRDPAVTQLSRDLNAARQAAATTAADMQKRKLAYADAMRLGRTALTAGRHADAVNAFTEALRQQPGDGEATRLLTQARQAMTDAAKAANAEAERRKAYDAQILRGRTAMTARRFDEAVAAYREALKVMPNDPTATKALAEAQAAMTPPKVEPKPKPKVEPKPKDPQPKPDPVRTAYTNAMNAGRQAMNRRQFDAAIRHFTDALRLVPNDPDALKALNEARTAAQPMPKAKDPQPKVSPKPKDPQPKGKDPQPKVDPKQAQFTQAMQAAAAAERQGKYFDALKQYQSALKLAPNDATAKVRASFCSAMIQGHRDLAAGKFAEAVIAFDQALRLDPKSADAKKALALARAGPPKKKQ
jgi:tetratricopeptide (TPR) repeat protein